MWGGKGSCLAVDRAAQENLVVDRVEVEARDEVRVLEDPEAIVHGNVPQPHGFIHAG